MLEPLLAVPYHFTIEFVGFLVLAGAAMLVPSRPVLVPGPLSHRLSAGLGFALLAVAQVAHGASFVALDSDPDWVLVRTLGLVLVVAGVYSGSRRVPVAPAFITLDAPILMAPAIASLGLSLAALAGATREGLATMWRLALAAILFAVAEVLTGLVPHAQFGQGVQEPLAFVAHGLRLLGYFALAAWLWTGVRVSIRTRFVSAFAALLMAVVLALSGSLTAVISNNVQREELNRLESQLRNAAQQVGVDEAAELLTQAQVISNNESIRKAVSDRQGVASLTEELGNGELFGEFDFAVITDQRGRLLSAAGTEPIANRREARSPAPLGEKLVQRILGSPVLLDAVDPAFQEAASVDRVDAKAVGVLAASEIRGADSPRSAGILVLGRWIDFLTIERISTLVAPARATLIGGGRVAASQLPRRVADEIFTDRIDEQLDAADTVSRRQSLQQGAYFSAFTHLTTGNGVPVATLALTSPDRVITQTRQDVTRSLFLVAMTVGAVALILAWLSGRRISGPIQRLTMTATQVREGNLDAKADVTGRDEVGQLGETFNEMTEALLKMTTDLRESAVEESRLRARIEAIIQSMADGLVAIDPDRNILAFNIEAELLTGLKADDVIGRPIAEVLEVTDPQGDHVELPVYTLNEGAVGGIFLGRTFGPRVPVAITSAVLKSSEDEIAGGVAVIRDMSREHELERMKSEFLSNISHELRTPLTPIKGYAEILGRKELPVERSQKFAKGILESTARLERIVELLVDFSAMEAGKLSPRSSPVDLRELMERLTDSWRERSPSHTFEVTVGEELPQVVGDERLLKRSLEEIIDNAVKFSPDGGTIALAAQAVASNGSSNGEGEHDRVVVRVRDEGIGITPEDLPLIFSDFRQLDGSETRTYGGLGLGLAFVRRIVEAHSGTIEVESRPDEGTVFTITLPSLVAVED